MLYALRHYSLPLMLALGLHTAAAWALYSGWNPEQETLNFVQPQTVVANLVVMQPKIAPRPDPAAAARARAAREEAQRKAAADQAAREAAERKRLQEEADAREAERVAAEKAAQDKAEADRLAAERAQQERLDRLSELAASSMQQAMDEESETFNSGTEEQVVRSYHAGIYDLVRRNWSRPPSARTGMSARLQVELIPTGEVIAVEIVESSGSAAFDRSAEIAVRQAKRFEVPTDNALFERHFRRFYFLFQPEDLLR